MKKEIELKDFISATIQHIFNGILEAKTIVNEKTRHWNYCPHLNYSAW